MGLFQNPLTQAMNPTITMPTVHPTKGITSRRTTKLSWDVFLLQDPETLQTYEEYARESFYEAERDQSPPYQRHKPQTLALRNPGPPPEDTYTTSMGPSKDLCKGHRHGR